MLSVSFYTLGCKLNQLESESLASQFRDKGFKVLSWALPGGEGGTVRACTDRAGCGDAADIYVINTCTVTSKAEQKARRMIRKALRDSPCSIVIATGCYAELDKPEIEALGSAGRLFVIPGSRKSALLSLPAFLAEAGGLEDPARIRGLAALWFSRFMDASTPPACALKGSSAGDPPPEELSENRQDASPRLPAAFEFEPFSFVPSRFSFHTRAFLKIQEGCDNRCSYCRVSLARGRSRSLEAAEVLDRVKRLENQGYAEAVLTGVNISQYRDVSPGQGGSAAEPLDSPDLAYLLKRLLRGTDRIKLRLSSIEPDAIHERLLETISSPRIQPHFHLSIQSGSSFILERMRRSYSPEEVIRKIGQLRLVKGDPFIACDIITGFPGESEAEFEKTCILCKEAGFAWIHAFPYSPRRGTEALDFKGKISEREAAVRVKRLIDLAGEGRRAYISRWLGREVDAVIEECCIKADEIEAGTAPYAAGLSDNYLKLLIRTNGKPSPPRGSILRCRLRCLPGGQSSRFDVTADM
ncbi:MAG: tRNA (N(6)-L-threonylcarbamoyladenosine(37)-C(2))-methylthiotransferase MtaB [Treponema sp.]|jgi:threonylcarbamoyladenosine tRNA methylthiotransferase MtaB|nr:tRNA (N(6)-L-threonylcarbamoyladenosine(37)-C(2))-methylthiotransferase MtaB [Treponema sp.]